MKTSFKKANLRAKIIILSAVAIVFSIAVSLIIISNAAFTNSRSAQRTIAAYDDIGIRFSSNYLVNTDDSSNNVRSFYSTNSASLPTVPITISNYPAGNPQHFDESDIEYTFFAKIVKFDSANNEYVDATESDLLGRVATISHGNSSSSLLYDTPASILSYSVNDILEGGSAVTDKFSISFGNGFIGDENTPTLAIEVVITPSASGLPTLRGIVKPEIRAAGMTNNWTGAFRESTSNTPDSYDGYNFLISGAGSGNCSLIWNKSIVDISEISKNMLLAISGSSYSESNNICTLVFPVDSDDESRYDIQFYKVNVTSAKTWAQLYTEGSSSTDVQFKFE